MHKLAYNTLHAAAMLDLGVTKFREVMRTHGIEPIRHLGDARWRHSDLERVIADPAPPSATEAAAAAARPARRR